MVMSKTSRSDSMSLVAASDFVISDNTNKQYQMLNKLKEENVMLPQPISKKTVSFSTVEIRDYPIILGDNPAVSHGPAVTIDWKPISTVLKTVEMHEATVIVHRRPVQMAIPLVIREFMLRDIGYTSKELLEATRNINRIKAKRAATVRRLQMARLEEVLEGMRKNISGVFYKNSLTKFGCHC